MSKFFFFIPDQASSVAPDVDLFFAFMVVVSAFFSLSIAGLIVYFGLRYRHGRVPQAPLHHDELELGHASHSQGALVLEIAWTVIPLGLCMVMFVWGTRLFFTLARAPADSVQMYAIGKQWMWKFQHPEGRREINELHVPVGQNVQLMMNSEDVIHSLFVPAFRVKQDVVPGRYTSLWFRATQTGTFHLFCAEYCGTQHSGMIGHVTVMEPRDYEAWLAGGTERSTLTLAQAGEKLFTERACATCHLPTGQGRGPSLIGVAGAPVKLASGGTVVADETYLRESILMPATKLTAGFEPVMPTFQGQLSEEQVVALVAYIKSLSKQHASPQSAAAAEAHPAKE
jgi:cytochrome c oxidase subunit 2